MPGIHSKFGASSAKRLLACPASYGLTEKVNPPNTSSKFADEGTVAHALAEDRLAGDNKIAVGDTLAPTPGVPITIDQDMADYVSTYTDYVELLKTLGYQVFLEQQVSPAWLWNEHISTTPPIPLFGTADCIAWNEETGSLVIADLKFGRGVPVDVEWNPQLLYYALGAMRFLADKLGKHFVVDMIAGSPPVLKSVRTTIVQPRAPHPDGPVREWIYDPYGVVQWGTNTLMPGVRDAVEVPYEKQRMEAGDHCQFCPVRAHCPELMKLAASMAAATFDPSEIIEEELPELLVKADAAELWISAIRHFAHGKMLDGHEVPGFKLVAKRATRKWTNEDEVEEILSKHGLGENLTHDRSLRTPTQVLKHAKGNRALTDALNERIAAVSSGTTIAPDNDPRPAVSPRRSADDVFTDDEMTE